MVQAVAVQLLSGAPYGDPADAGSANPDLNFRYDPALQGYVFNLKTTGYPSGVYRLAYTVGSDPTLHYVQFQVR